MSENTFMKAADVAKELDVYILRLKSENEQLRPKVQQYEMLCKYLGQNHVDALLTAIRIKTHSIEKQKGANHEHGTYQL